jgi:Carboxypeptidase regulatory-like domain
MSRPSIGGYAETILHITKFDFSGNRVYRELRFAESFSGPGSLGWRTMLFMESIRRVLGVIVAGLLLLVTTAALGASEVICNQTQLKPMRHICGIVIDATGSPVAHAKVAILSGETEVAAIETGQDGKFAFDGPKARSYDVRAQALGFQNFQFPIVLVKPGGRCKRALEVVLVTASESCPGARLVSLKVVERRLHTSP